MTLANTLIASLLVQVDGDSTGAYRALQQIDSAFLGTTDKANTFARSMLSSTALIGTATGVLGAGAIKLAIDYESSFAGIRKTVDATEREYAELGQQLRNLSKEIPVSVNELNRIGEAAGQLGIGSQDIAKFVEVMANLGATTNLSSLQAAEGLARLANITQMPMENIDRLGSVVVDLGNKFAATEQNILDYGLRIAGAGEISGMTESEILAIGTAMSSVGVQAEAGGTALQKTILGIEKAVTEGSDKVGMFAQTAGMSAAQFAEAWRTDPAETFTRFVEGLGKQGNEAILTLDALDLSNERLIRAMLAISSAGDLLRTALETGRTAWEENTALTEEAGKRYETTASQLKILGNTFQDAGITLGEMLLPKVVEFLQYMQENVPKALNWLNENYAGKIAAIGDAFGLVLGPVVAVGQAFMQNEQAVIQLGDAILIATTAMVALGAALLVVGVMTNPFVMVAAGAVGLSLALVVLHDNLDNIEAGFMAVGDAVFAAADAMVFGTVELGQRAVEAVVGFVGEMIASVVGMAADMYNAGVDAAQGLYNGLVDGFTAPIEEVASWPHKLVNAIQDFADGHSPWGIMIPVGEDMVYGLVAGVEAAAPALEVAALNAVAQASGAAAAQAAADISAIQEHYARVASGNISVIGPPGTQPFTPQQMADLAAQAHQDLIDLQFPPGSEGPFIGMSPADIAMANQRALRDRISSVGSIPGIRSGGGGGSGSGAADVAKSAAEEFAAAWQAELDAGALADAFGDTGAQLLTRFSDALESPSSAASLPGIIGKLIEQAEAEGVPNAEELGQNLANAVAEGLASGNSEGIKTAMGALNDAMKAAGELTIDSFSAAIGSKAADRATQERLGAAGAKVMDALGEAMDKGGKKNIDKLADVIDGLVEKLADKAPEAQAAFLGTSLMEAVKRAIEEKSPEAQTALGDALAKINQIMLGGAIDIRTGTVIAADAIEEMARTFKVNKDVIIENIRLIVDSGLANMAGALDTLPDKAREAIAQWLKILAEGKVAADQFVKGVGSNLPGGGIPGQGGDTSQVMPHETIAELVERITGMDVFGGSGFLMDSNGRVMSAQDIISSVVSGNFVRDFMFGGITVGGSAIPGAADRPFGYRDPNTGLFWREDVDPNFEGNQPGWSQHQFGLYSVPYDGYRALLHRGERVLTAQEAQSYNGGGNVFHISIVVEGDGDTAKIERAVIRVLENELVNGAINQGITPYAS